MRLVEEVEDDRPVVLELLRHAAPEVGRVVTVGHRLLVRGQCLTGRGPVQVQDHPLPRRVEPVDVLTDGRPVVLSGVPRVDAVDAQPAGLVEGHAHGVGARVRDPAERDGVRRSVEDAPTLHACVLRARPVHSQEADLYAASTDESTVVDADGEPIGSALPVPVPPMQVEGRRACGRGVDGAQRRGRGGALGLGRHGRTRLDQVAEHKRACRQGQLPRGSVVLPHDSPVGPSTLLSFSHWVPSASIVRTGGISSPFVRR